jgi:acylphosphatase
MAEIRKHIVFHGRVQGVGFRITATRYALNLGLKGWVKNEYNGTVIMEVQGNETLINRLLIALNSERYIQIEWMDAKEVPLGNEKSFSYR